MLPLVVVVVVVVVVVAVAVVAVVLVASGWWPVAGGQWLACSYSYYVDCM